MTPERYLDLLASEATLLADTADAIDLDAPVPTCPGWSARDAVEHTGMVYHHKIACMQLGRRPEDDEYAATPAPGQGSVEFFREALAALLEELVRRGPPRRRIPGGPTIRRSGSGIAGWHRRRRCTGSTCSPSPAMYAYRRRPRGRRGGRGSHAVPRRATGPRNPWTTPAAAPLRSAPATICGASPSIRRRSL